MIKISNPKIIGMTDFLPIRLQENGTEKRKKSIGNTIQSRPIRPDNDGTVSKSINTPATIIPLKNHHLARTKKSAPAHLYIKYVRRYIQRKRPIRAGKIIVIRDMIL